MKTTSRYINNTSHSVALLYAAILSMLVFATTAKATDPVINYSFPIRVNFQPSTSALPVDKFVWNADFGGVFSFKDGFRYGWDKDIQSLARERNIHPLQKRDTHVEVGGTWEFELPEIPGRKYNIFLVCGDPLGSAKSINSVVIEGVEVIDQDGPDKFDVINLQGVPVDDGKLTITPAASASNLKLTHIKISRAN